MDDTEEVGLECLLGIKDPNQIIFIDQMFVHHVIIQLLVKLENLKVFQLLGIF